MNKNYIEYNTKHWSKIKDSELALSKYLNNYEDIYNIINIEKYSNFPFFYDFGHTGFYAGEIIGNEISIELNKFNLF